MKVSLAPTKRQRKGPALAGLAELPDLDKPYIEGYLKVGPRSVPRVSSRLGLADRLGWLRMRLGAGRGDYRVLPGLYALGSPDPASPVLVSANYKLSFDALRKELGGIDTWILVLDTKGINVWCAASKGTFGTAELLAKLKDTRLGELVSHKVLVLPQLGATGVSAPEIARKSGYRVAWGPVLASDIPAFLAAGMRKTEAMRLVPFGLRERMAVSPVEFVQAWPLLAGTVAVSALAALPAGPAWSLRFAWALAALAGSVLVGSFALPAFLPLVPARAFGVKGALLGFVWGGAMALLSGSSPALSGAFLLASASVAAYIGMGFTGASTFTSQAGAALEVEKGLPWMIGCLALGLCLGAAARLFGI